MVWESLSKRLSRIFTLPRLGSSANPHRLPYAALNASVSALVYELVAGRLGGAITVGLSRTCGHRRAEM